MLLFNGLDSTEKPTENGERFCCQELPPVFVAQDSADDENCQSEEVKIDENVNPPSLTPMRFTEP